MTSEEMQLAKAAGLPIAGSDLVHAHGPHHVKPTGMKKIHRLLRGRYPMVLTLGLVFAIAGAMLGYLSQKPQYTSRGEIEIDPTIHTVGNANGEQMSGYSMFLQSQVAEIQGPALIERAMSEDEWKSVGGAVPDDAAVTQFASSLDVENVPGTTIIRISYSDPDPKMAQAGAAAVCRAYKEFYQETDPLMMSGQLKELAQEQAQYQNDLSDYQGHLADLTKVYHSSDLSTFQAENMQQWAVLGNRLNDDQAQLNEDLALLGQAQSATNAPNGKGPAAPPPLTEDQIAPSQPKLQELQSRREALLNQIAVAKAEGYGDQHPQTQDLEINLSVVNDQIKAFVDKFNQGYRVDPVTGQFGEAPGATSLKAEVTALKFKIKNDQEQYDKQTALCTDIGNHAQWIYEVKNNIAQAQENLNQVNTLYNKLVSERDLMANNQMRVISNPITSSIPAIDRRKEMAGIGFIFGGLMPAFVVLLVGLLDGRFRYSDETNTDLNGVPLLGILPNLPDLLTDPSQAATAAHCVHQIRTILQITGHNADRRVFSITSASPGDGKTSLTLALGLSFAASGSRTLLVDGDLIGGGLTARLNVTADHGVLEAMAARDILPYIRATDVADLSFLPVGQAMGGYTGTISPAAVRRLVDEARKHFDILLVDTGPILGSIEASPVAVASDGVVLCVARGQQRQLVDRALAHLHAIGAKLSGVVFNRAQAHDFERSTNRLGSIATSNGNGRQRGEAIGPVARAVASSVRSATAGPGERSR